MEINVIGNKSEIYAGGGKWLTENKATCFPTFTRRRFLRPGETIDDFKEISDSEKTALEKLRDGWTRPPQSFIDLWNEACGPYGRYNEETGYFELNGLRDITYEEAIRIYTTRNGRGVNSNRFYSMKLGRTTFPILVHYEQRNINSLFHGASGIQKVVFKCDDGANTLATTFHNSSVTHIEGLVIEGNTSIGINFAQHSKITYADIKLLKYTTAKTIDFRYFLLDALNWRLIIEKSAVHTAQVSIIVNKSTYSKLTDHDDPEWYALSDLASEKNITFATI